MHENAFESPFQKDEACFSEAVFFGVLMEDGEETPARPRCVPFPNWEVLEGPLQNSKEKASISNNPP